jgi:hypothetical protein
MLMIEQSMLRLPRELSDIVKRENNWNIFEQMTVPLLTVYRIFCESFDERLPNVLAEFIDPTSLLVKKFTLHVKYAFFIKFCFFHNWEKCTYLIPAEERGLLQ